MGRLLDQEKGGRIEKARSRGILYLELVSYLPLFFSAFLFVVSSLKANLSIGVAEFYIQVFFAAFSFTLGLNNCVFLQYPLARVQK